MTTKRTWTVTGEKSKSAICREVMLADLGWVATLGPRPPVRTPDANARMWAGPLADVASQAWVNGRQYSAEVWHEHFKREFLPEDDDIDIGVMAKDGYRKWDYTPSGDRVLIGSTTQLTRNGFAQYLEQLMAFGSSEGVKFSASPREHGQ